MEVSMPTANRTFRRAVAKQKVTRPTVRFGIERMNDDGEVLSTDWFNATMPTDENMFLIAALIGDEDNEAGAATALLELLKDSLPTDEYRLFRKRLRDPKDEDVTMETVEDIVEELMKEWSAFPTGQSAASSTSQTTSGPKSTGRVRGEGSTRSPSASIGS
jgi:hypothetical protein